MNLQYLKNLHLWKEVNQKGKGVKEEEIESLEEKTGKQFPVGYREFLLLAGGFFTAIPLGHRFKYLETFNQNALYNLKEYGFESLIPKDFWVVAEMEGSDYIHYIHFDEGENPPVYGLSMADYEDEPTEEYHKKIADSFSEYIQGFIDRYDPRYD